MAQLEYKLVIPCDKKAMPQITLLPPPVVHSTDDTIICNGYTYKKVDDVLPFKTNKNQQHEMLYYVQCGMLGDGLNKDFVDDVIALAHTDAGVFDLCELWFNEKNINEQMNIVHDLLLGLEDYKYDTSKYSESIRSECYRSTARSTKPVQDHAYDIPSIAAKTWEDTSEYSAKNSATQKLDVDGCDYVVRQEIMDDKNIMQLEYWNEYLGAWQFKKSDASLFYRHEAIEVAKSLRNPPSDGRVHIAKRTKKAKPAKKVKDIPVCDKKVWHVNCPCDKTESSKNYIITKNPLGGAKEVLTTHGWFDFDANILRSDRAIDVSRARFQSTFEVERFVLEQAEKTLEEIIKASYDKDVEFRIEKGNQ